LIKHTYDELKLKLTNAAITPEQELDFRALIDEFGEVFALVNEDIPKTNRMQFKIHMEQDARPIRQKLNSYSQGARAGIERKIQKMLVN